MGVIAASALGQREHGGRDARGKKMFSESIAEGPGKNTGRRAGLLPPGGDLHQPIGTVFKGGRGI